MPKQATIAKTTMIATNEAGITLVIFGNPITMAMVNATNPSMVYNGEPANQVSVPCILNWLNCHMKIIIASPFTNPNITGCGTSLMNLPHLKILTKICIAPASATAAKT